MCFAGIQVYLFLDKRLYKLRLSNATAAEGSAQQCMQQLCLAHRNKHAGGGGEKVDKQRQREKEREVGESVCGACVFHQLSL